MVVAENLRDYKDRAHLDSVDSASRQDPKLGTYLAQPEKSALVKDDISGTSAFANALKLAGGFMTFKNTLPQYLSGVISRGLSRSRTWDTLSNSSMSMFANAAEWGGENISAPLHRGIDPVAAMFKQVDTSGNVVRTGADVVNQAGVGQLDSAVQKARDVGKFGRDQQQAISKNVGALPTARDWIRNPGAAAEQAVAHLTNQAVGSAPAMALGLATRNPEVAAAAMGISSGAQQYSDERAQGTSINDANKIAGMNAAAEAVGEEFAITRLFNPKWAKMAITQPLAEYTQEFATQIMQDTSDAGVKGQNVDWSQELWAAHEAGLTGAWTGAATGTGAAAIHYANEARSASRDRAARQEAGNALATQLNSMNGSAYLQNVTQAAQGFKLNTRSKQDAAEFVLHMGGDSVNVYIPASEFTTLFQDRAPEFAAELTGDPHALTVAGESGDIVVPMSKYATELATLPNADEIAHVSRVRAEDMSRKELESSDFAKVVADIQGRVDTPEARQLSTDVGSIHSAVHDALVASGAHKTAEAKTNATMMAAFFGTMSQRTGINARQLFDRYNLKINGIPVTTGSNASAKSDSGESKTLAQNDGHALMDIVENNGSGESAASVEAITRQRDENATGQLRMLIDRDGSVARMTGVGAVDAHARSGQVIVQRGIGSDEWTVLSHGEDLSKDRVAGIINRARPDLGGNPPFIYYQSPANSGVFSDQTQTPEFKRWFGDSKVVDSDGKPLVVYHGSDASFDMFSGDALGSKTSAKSARLGFFFTDDAALASDYTAIAGWNEGDGESFGASFNDWSSAKKGAQVYPVYLSVQNPKVIDYAGAEYREVAFSKALKDARDEGHDGAIFRNARDSVYDTHDVPADIYVAFHPEQIKSAIGNSGAFDSNDPNILHQAEGNNPNASIEIGNAGININLNATANRSSFMHEASHLFLHIMDDLANEEGAPDQVKDDYETIRNFIGLSPGEEIGSEHHEKFARSFESYLMTGKAPSEALIRPFARFAKWMTDIYRNIRNLIGLGAIDLNPEITDVMDRMLAVNEEIESVKQRQGIVPMLTMDEFKKLGFTDKQWETYVGMLESAVEEARADVTARVLKAHMREKTSEREAERKDVVAQLKATLEQSQSHKTWQALKAKDAPKLDLNAIKRDYNDAQQKLMRGLDVARLNDGIHPDVMAEQFGYDSGDALIQDLLQIRDRQNAIEGLSHEEMRRRYPDPIENGELEGRVMRALHGSKRLAALESELAMLAKLASSPAPNARILRGAARQVISGLTARKLQPNTYLVTERKAARLAMEAAAKGDFPKALQFKREQTLQATLYSEARQAQVTAMKQIKAIQKIAKPASLKRIGKAGKSYVDALRSILAGHEIGRVSAETVKRRDALRRWADRMQEDGNNTAISEDLLDRIESERVTNVADLTMQQLADLHEAVQNISALASLKNKLVTKSGKIDFADAKRQIIDRINDVLGDGKPLPIADADKTAWQSFKDGVGSVQDWLLKVETMVEWLDGGDSGPMHDLLFTPSEDAQAKRWQLNKLVASKLEPAINGMSRADRNALNQKVMIRSLGRSVSKQTIFSALLNMGNASNRDKLLRGGMRINGQIVPFTEPQLAEMFSHLNSGHARAAQEIWDSIEQLWPEIVKMEEDTSGFAPPKVDPAPFTVMTKDGPVPLSGGYYPMVYDPKKSRFGAKSEEDKVKRQLGGTGITRATTSKGHTVARTEYAAPLLLDWHAVITSHLDDVMNDISHRRFLSQMNRVLDDEEINNVISERLSPNVVRYMRKAFERGAVGIKPMAGPAFGPLQNLANGTMTNLAAAALGFRAILSFANIATAPVLAKMGGYMKSRYVAEGFAMYYASPIDSTKLIHDLSPMMEQRARARDTDTATMLATLRGKRGMRKQMIELSMHVHQLIVPLAERALWIGRYRQALATGNDTAEAARLADKMIRQTQTTNYARDLSAVESTPWLKPAMMFAGPLIVINNRLQEAGMRGHLRGSVDSPMKAIATWIAATLGGSLVFELIMGRPPDDEDKDGDETIKDWIIWCARKIFLMPFQAIPFIRDAASYIDDGHARPSPLVDAMKTMYDAAKVTAQNGDALAFGEGEVDAEKQVKATVKAAGVATGIPSNQLTKTGTYLMDVASGNRTPDGPMDLYYLNQGRPRKGYDQ